MYKKQLENAWRDLQTNQVLLEGDRKKVVIENYGLKDYELSSVDNFLIKKNYIQGEYAKDDIDQFLEEFKSDYQKEAEKQLVKEVK